MFDLIFIVLEELGAAGGKAATTKNSLSSLDMFDVRCSSFFSFFGTLGQGLERGRNFLLSPASAPGEVHNSIFDWTVSLLRETTF